MTTKSRKRSSLLGIALLALAGAAGGLSAQSTTTAGIAGSIRTADGEAVPTAEVVIRNSATGVTNRAITGQNGRYFIPYLKPGAGYVVEVNALGYGTQREENVRLTLGDIYELNFTLQPQAVSAGEIRVTTARGDVFSPTHMGAQTTVDESAIEDQPSIDRHINDLAALSPYVSLTGDAPSVGGQNNRMNNIQIDGAVNNDVFGLAASGVPGGQANAKPIPIDAIAQFEVLVAPFDVRQAGFSGGLINAVTKSGTNQWTGSLYGYYRNENFLNNNLKYTLPVAGGGVAKDSLTTADFLDQTLGFSMGGPIVKDKLHLYAAGEFQRREYPLFYGISSDPARIRQSPDSIQRFINILENQYGFDPGDPTAYAQKNPNSNVFARLDWSPSEKHRITFRDNFVHASDASSPSRGGSYFTLSSGTYSFESNTNSAVLQVHSTFAQDLFNELLVNYERVRDRRNPLGSYPLIQVDNTSSLSSGTVNGTLQAGAELYSQANELDQDIVQITDNFTKVLGAHRATLGGQVEYYHFRNLFAPGTMGQWGFDSLTDFQGGNASSYFVNVPYGNLTVADLAAKFGVYNLSAYVQDEWTVNSQLTLSGGLRFDVPVMPDKPRSNPEFQQAFGLSTAVVPSGNFNISPRLGFNWQVPGDVMTQVRGGAGLFTGRPPFVWLSNQYGNTGHEMVALNCRGSNAPAFTSGAPPTTCADGTPATASGVMIVNVFDKDFRFPQELKISLAVDRELPWDLRATVEGLYTKSINQIAMKDLNFNYVGQSNPADAIGNRPVFGTPVDNSYDAMAPDRVNSAFGPVIELTNDSKNYAYLFNFELQRKFFENIDVRAAYTYSRAFATQNLTSSIATSNYGYNAISGDPNDPPVAPSSFDRPHKILLTASGTFFEKYGGTTLSAFYIGRSGKRYYYIYDGDVNGDGYETYGVVNNRNNDLAYIPNSSSEITWSPTGRPAAEDERLYNELVSLEPCLQESKGSIMEAFACQGPWSNQLNMKLQQGIPLPTQRGKVALTVDVFNVLNLLNHEWGLDQGPLYGDQYLLQLRGRDNATGAMQFDYYGPTVTQDGVQHAVKPYTTFFDSRWSIQTGVRVTF